MMKLVTAAFLAAAALAACSTPEARIRGHQAEFNAYPAEVRQKIRMGKAAVGFSPEQVKLALGEPDRFYTRKSSGTSRKSGLTTERGRRTSASAPA